MKLGAIDGLQSVKRNAPNADVEDPDAPDAETATPNADDDAADDEATEDVDDE